jgi:hypothetical protein
MENGIELLKKLKLGLGIVVYACNLSDTGGGDRKIKVQVQPRQKLVRQSLKIVWMWLQHL